MEIKHKPNESMVDGNCLIYEEGGAITAWFDLPSAVKDLIAFESRGQLTEVEVVCNTDTFFILKEFIKETGNIIPGFSYLNRNSQ